MYVMLFVCFSICSFCLKEHYILTVCFQVFIYLENETNEYCILNAIQAIRQNTLKESIVIIKY